MEGGGNRTQAGGKGKVSGVLNVHPSLCGQCKK